MKRVHLALVPAHLVHHVVLQGGLTPAGLGGFGSSPIGSGGFRLLPVGYCRQVSGGSTPAGLGGFGSPPIGSGGFRLLPVGYRRQVSRASVVVFSIIYALSTASIIDCCDNYIISLIIHCVIIDSL